MNQKNKENKTRDKVNLGIAWTHAPDSFTYVGVKIAAGETGANVKILDMVKSGDLNYDENNKLVDAKDEKGVLSSGAAKIVKEKRWKNSNVEEVLRGIDCLILPGGCDISPTLLKEEQPWHDVEGDEEVCAERDVSDYILMSYCLDKDIPVLCICRGMQLMGVVSGADMVQDLPKYFEEIGVEYNYFHREAPKVYFMSHSADVAPGSLLHKIMGTDCIEGCPSWHHQMVKDVRGTGLVVTATTNTNGVNIIEAIERPDLQFCLGVQYHPEIPVRILALGEYERETMMDHDTAMKVFNALIDAAM